MICFWWRVLPLADLIVDCRAEYVADKAVLIPKTLVVGVGCNRGTPVELITRIIEAKLHRARAAAPGHWTVGLH